MTLKATLFALSIAVVLAGGQAKAALVGHWAFDESNGTAAADSSGYGNNGILVNMKPATDWVAGKAGNALSFDGVDDYVDLGNPASGILDISGAISVAAWINPMSGHSSWNYVVRYKSKFEFGGYNGSDESPEFKVKNDAGSRFSVHGDDLSQGQWYHIVGVRDGSFLGIYVDGVQN